MSPSQNIQGFINSLVPPGFDEEDIQELIRARFFVLNLILFFVGTITLFTLWTVVSKGGVSLNEWLVVMSSLSIQFFSFFMFVSKGKLDIATRLLVWTHFLFIVVLIAFSNGIHSPFVVALIFLPVICSFLINIEHCKVMLGVTAFLLILFILLEVNDIRIASGFMDHADSLRVLLVSLCIAFVVTAFFSYEVTVSNLMNALVEEKNKFLHLAQHDALTGLLSYEAFEKILEANLEHETEFAIFYIDIKNFWMINQRYSHEEGDRVLQIIAARISEALRNDDVIARVESDEFILLINDITKKTDLLGIADNIRNSVGASINVNDGENAYAPDCRLGMANTLKGARTKATLLSLAKAKLV